jgi:hypothetical protein
LCKCLIAALATGIGSSVALDAGFVLAADLRKLSEPEIRAKLAGMQLTDEVHYRLVYDRNGTLRSYSMGVKKTGKWTIEKDQLCLYLGETEDGCYEVTQSGERIEMTPVGLGGSIDGILQPAYDN